MNQALSPLSLLSLSHTHTPVPLDGVDGHGVRLKDAEKLGLIGLGTFEYFPSLGADEVEILDLGMERKYRTAGIVEHLEFVFINFI